MKVLRNNKLIIALATFTIVCFGMFSICSKAASGKYINLTGYGDNSASVASAINVSNASRYVNIVMYTDTGARISSGGKVLGPTNKITLQGGGLAKYSHVYASSSAYATGAPQSGIVEQLKITIK